MFPGGAAGFGLVLLRVCAAGTLVRNITADATVSITTWEIAGVIILAGAFCLGAFTPAICSVSSLLQAFMLVRAHQPDPFQFAFSLCVTAALFLLGPGAFSLDSRLYGRRLIVHSDSR
jgi:ABC-type multidrug transport system permease subunit